MRKKVRKLMIKKAHKKMCRDPMTNPVMTSLTAMMAVMKNAQKTAQIRQKRNGFVVPDFYLLQTLFLSETPTL
ncbi:hypothetical protein ABNQ16_005440 [Escherichia coli]